MFGVFCSNVLKNLPSWQFLSFFFSLAYLFTTWLPCGQDSGLCAFLPKCSEAVSLFRQTGSDGLEIPALLLGVVSNDTCGLRLRSSLRCRPGFPLPGAPLAALWTGLARMQ